MSRLIREVVDLREIVLAGTDLDFLRSLGGPTLIRQQGKNDQRTRFVATLLHGNEPSGARAVQRWLRQGRAPTTNVVFYIGSVQAALTLPEFSQRNLPGHRDANRCFHEPPSGPDGLLARELLEAVHDAGPEVLIDLHNNTGNNPAYGVVASLDDARARLVGLFAQKCVLSDLRLGTLIEATDAHFPSVVIECGRAGTPEADAVAFTGLSRFLLEDPLVGLDAPPPDRLEVLEHPIRVTLLPGIAMSFGRAPGINPGCTFCVDLDRHNFQRCEAGTVVGWLEPDCAWPLHAAGADGRDQSHQLFRLTDDALVLNRPLIPIMVTLRMDIAKSDCLFYATTPRST